MSKKEQGNPVYKKTAKMELPKKVLFLKDLVHYELNNKIHGDRKTDLLANIISKFGFIDEIVVDENNIIIAGHGRAASLLKMGYDSVEVKILQGFDANDIEALRLLHNKIAEFDTRDNLENIEVVLNLMGDYTVQPIEGLKIEPIVVKDLRPELKKGKKDEGGEDYGDSGKAKKVVCVVLPSNDDELMMVQSFLDENNISYKVNK